MESESPIKDGRVLRISHVEPQDAAEMVAYVDRAGGESDFLSFGEGESGSSVEDAEKGIASLEGGQHNFALKGWWAGRSFRCAGSHGRSDRAFVTSDSSALPWRGRAGVGGRETDVPRDVRCRAPSWGYESGPPSTLR